MGEVKTQVRLINATDEALARRGQLAPDQVRVYETNAVVDTNAVSTAIPTDVAQALGLDATDQRAVYADGRNESVDVVGPIAVVIRGRCTLEEALVFGNEVLIGKTVMGKLDLHVDGHNQRVSPNPAHPDQAVNKVK
jgi:predicted aspartyl protease